MLPRNSLLVDGLAVGRTVSAANTQHAHAPGRAGRIYWYDERDRRKRRDRGARTGSNRPYAYFHITRLITPYQHALRARGPGGRVAGSSASSSRVGGVVGLVKRVQKFHGSPLTKGISICTAWTDTAPRSRR